MSGPFSRMRPVERLVFFTDAVVAIALTLLILPLLESVAEAARADLGAVEYAREHDGQLFAFVLSFLIIGLLWRSHERTFEQVDHQDSWLFWLNLLWMFTIVSLPVTTAIVGAMDTDAAQLALYIGTLLASSLLMLAIQAHLVRVPALTKAGHTVTVPTMIPGIVTTALFALALLLALVVPGLQFWSLLALLLRVPAIWLARRARISAT